MAALWQNSLQPYGSAFVGAQAEFFDEDTTTPQVVYTTAALSIAHDQPVVANSLGMFPAVFLSPTPGSYRVRVTDADDVELWDEDGISVPQDADYVPPDAGDTSETLLFRTGMRIGYYGATAPSGWVRANGRTIGSAASGASERANDDTEDLFVHLWGVDSALSVSGGRGANAAADWAANKTMALPDYRDRIGVGGPAMGNSDAARISDTYLAAALGSAGGLGVVTLTINQIPVHTHTASFAGAALAGHAHNLTADGVAHGANGVSVSDFYASNGNVPSGDTPTQATSSVSAGTPSGTVTVQNAGGGLEHSNLQPSIVELVIIKL